MNYQKTYDNLISTRRYRVIDSSVYYEKHHVIMRSMGGQDTPENVVKLTPREHFIAHWLLWQIHRNKPATAAFFIMCGKRKNDKRNLNTSSRTYSFLKEEWYDKMSETFRKQKLTPEKIAKMAAGRIGKTRSQEVKMACVEGRRKAGIIRKESIVLHTHVCKGCSSTFECWREKRVYCSRECKMKFAFKVPHNATSIIQYDLLGAKVQEYSSISLAALETGIDRMSIWSNVNSKAESAGNFIWKQA